MFLGCSFSPIKNVCYEMFSFWNTSDTSLGKLGSKMIQGRLLIADLQYTFKKKQYYGTSSNEIVKDVPKKWNYTFMCIKGQ